MLETYLQKAWGDSIENVTIEEIRVAINELPMIDDEHGAFWVGIVSDIEFVLETNKNLTVIGVFSEDLSKQIKVKFNNWNDIEDLYAEFLKYDFERVKSILESMNNNNSPIALH